MSRWVAIVPDPTAGGTRLDDIRESHQGAAGSKTTPSVTKIPKPTIFIPATTAQMDPGLAPGNRDDEVRGTRANAPPYPFKASPQFTFESRAYPKIVRPILRAALGGAVNHVKGAAKIAYEDIVPTLQEGNLPAIIAWLRRESQLDRCIGVVISEFTLNFPVDAEGTISVTGHGLYKDMDKVTGVDTSAAKEPGEGADTAGAKGGAGETVKDSEVAYGGYDYCFTLRDAEALRGAGEGTEIATLGGFSLTFNNGLIEEGRARFRPNHNVEAKTVGGKVRKIWWPERAKLGPQTLTGEVALSDVDTTSEEQRIFAESTQLIFNVTAGPIEAEPALTTPTEESMRLRIYSHTPTTGGAEPLVRQGDQQSTYQFSGNVDAAGKDIDVTFVGGTQLT